MAGHSKWANIKHRKSKQDAAKGKVFTKIIRELTVAAKSGASVSDNPRLRMAVDKALAANMTRDTIDRAIARGTGNSDTSRMSEVTYEGYSAGGVAVIIEAMTDNRNRTISAIRHAFSRHGGNLGTEGAVTYMFERKGQLTFDSDTDENDLITAGLDAGAEDIISEDDGTYTMITSVTSFIEINNRLQDAGFNATEAEIVRIPSIESPVTTLEAAHKIIRLVDALEDCDDVQNVFHNAMISEDIMPLL